MIPIWLLYFMPFYMVPNYAIKLALVGIAVFTVRKWICHMEKSVKAFFWERETLKSWGVGILAELAGLGLFCVSEMNVDIEFYNQYYLQFSVAALLLAIILNVLLDYKFVFRKINSKLRRLLAALLTTAAAAPYLFLMPQ